MQVCESRVEGGSVREVEAKATWVKFDSMAVAFGGSIAKPGMLQTAMGVQSTCDALLVTCCCFFSMFAPHPKTQIDQAALTGESLPVKKFTSGVAFSGSTVKMGERHCVVYATGVNTFFGRAAALISGTVNVANIQKVMTKIGAICLVTIGIWVIIELAVQFGHYGHECTGGEEGCPTLTNMLVIIVGGIPIAMPTVLSVTLALGAAALAKEGAIVARMSAVEE
jgi:magnesium-transporting ATPase (P-type)